MYDKDIQVFPLQCAIIYANYNVNRDQ